ncbi:MFS transporter [Pseudonocardia adelaidensis]|uniref:DHA2 family efflux MFS transporter permease subunit n=1 Tax=Pseudonocardia adelaidensis TaxID=648754 RepID=A0ABP9NMQ1_9PSEU
MSTSAPAPARRRLGLLVIATAQFMVIMDTSIIGVALPKMQADLGFSPEGLSWVFNAYVVAFGGLLLLGGRLSDLFGARRLFALGWAVLLGGSVLAGAAGNATWELTGRAVQGAGAALIAPAALTLLMMLFGSEPEELTKALALYGAAAPAGGTAGVFLGGVLTEYLSWPWVFYLNVPIAIAVLAITPSVMPAGGQRRGSVDLVGAVTVTAGLALAVYGIVRAPDAGWLAAETVLAVGAALVLLAAFVAIQARRRDPLVRLGIFRAPDLAAANTAQLLLGAAWIPMWFFLNLYLQQVLGYTAFPSGAALLPMTIVIMIGMIALAPRLIGRFGPKALTVTGLVLLAVGMAGLAFVRPDGTFWVDVLPASIVAAAGMSLAFIPSLGTALSAARPEEGGLASGIVNTSYQVGSALGLAAIAALAAVNGADALGDPVTLTSGYSAAFAGAAIVALAGAVLAAATLRKAPKPASEPAEAGV